MACGIIHCGTRALLWCAGFSLAVACGFSLSSYGVRVLECVVSVVCGMLAVVEACELGSCGAWA